MGGWLCIDGVYSHFFECPITDNDCEIYGHPAGTSEGQQTWECLAILVAIDVWAGFWNTECIILKLKGDNIGALTLLTKMRPASLAIVIIVRELALRLAELSFPPDAVHTPGIAHVIADKLSRMHAPGGNIEVHPALRNATETKVPERDAAWYRVWVWGSRRQRNPNVGGYIYFFSLRHPAMLELFVLSCACIKEATGSWHMRTFRQ